MLMALKRLWSIKGLITTTILKCTKENVFANWTMCLHKLFVSKTDVRKLYVYDIDWY